MENDPDNDSLESELEGLFEDESEAVDEEDSLAARLNAILFDAVARDATEVHFDPHSEGLFVRIRQSGGKLLSRVAPDLKPSAVVARLKILGQIDIAERQRPQDGRFRLKTGGREVECALATLPTARGERAILRIKVEAVQPLSLQERDAPVEIINAARNALRGECGLIVAGCAPRDRTQLLAALLLEIDTDERIVAFVSQRQIVQDERVLAVQTREIDGFNVASALRATARHKADVIIVDQTLTREDLDLALALASEETIVVIGMPTDTPAEALLRIIELGLDPEDVADSFKIVVTEKRYDRLCPECRQQSDGKWEAAGCTSCIGGRKGNVFLYRLLENDDALNALLRSNRDLEHALEEEDDRSGNSFDDRLTGLIASGEVSASDVEGA